jgi:hypothetical protein
MGDAAPDFLPWARCAEGRARPHLQNLVAARSAHVLLSEVQRAQQAKSEREDNEAASILYTAID